MAKPCIPALVYKTVDVRLCPDYSSSTNILPLAFTLIDISVANNYISHHQPSAPGATPRSAQYRFGRGPRFNRARIFKMGKSPKRVRKRKFRLAFTGILILLHIIAAGGGATVSALVFTSPDDLSVPLQALAHALILQGSFLSTVYVLVHIAASLKRLKLYREYHDEYDEDDNVIGNPIPEHFRHKYYSWARIICMLLMATWLGAIGAIAAAVLRSGNQAYTYHTHLGAVVCGIGFVATLPTLVLLHITNRPFELPMMRSKDSG
ncbi:hypothetical protein B0T26DRAFT_141758 [Lasiosphaeria miniovina]|uniref:Uncharacterized protein n=1 Tax=Lasiosphaeria miniovina TaxID=1954250 RepID=A0AA40B4N4_9PEZI|nr:uncharacterized protein B0T26DRAFT_141758 [Lasiosphaeria miniovina]KAK0727645.1 hypothetical protein B0T26DRAFT_141758 [Lasiosphaeria miniovina]